MKRLWNMLSFLAVVNLLALVGLGLWLWKSDRLDQARVHQIRDMLAITLQEEQAQLDQEQQDAETEASQARRASLPEVPSNARLRRMSRLSEQELLAQRRLEDQRVMLQEGLERQEQQVRQQQQALREQEEKWQQTQDVGVARDADEQFAKAVGQLNALPAKQTKLILLELVNSGRTDQAVAYLDAMQSRASAKVLKEFKTPAETTLATELLERLRSFGLSTEADEDLADANTPDAATDAVPADPQDVDAAP